MSYLKLLYHINHWWWVGGGGGKWWWMVVGGGGGRPLQATGGHRGHFPHIDFGPAPQNLVFQRRQDPYSYACLGKYIRKCQHGEANIFLFDPYYNKKQRKQNNIQTMLKTYMFDDSSTGKE